MLKNVLLAVIFSVLVNYSGFSQNEVSTNPPEYIKSIILRPLKTNNYTPYIQLGSSFVLEFDDLDGDQKQYTYKVEHYDYNWQKSNLVSTEYLDGFSDDWIRNFENSFNTIQNYTHYKLVLPNDNLSITKSGNYIISVIDEDDEIVFSRPFIMYEPLVTVGTSVHRSREIATINTQQNVQFSINHPDMRINNPHLEIKTVIYQNADWNFVKKDMKPQFIRGNQMLYKYGANLNFWGGNEFLFFDTKQIRGATNNIARSELKDEFNSYLYTDEVRANRPYTLYPDINGSFVPRTLNGDIVDTEGDYSWVHFTLEVNENIENKDIYVYGAFNNWQLTENNKMEYNSKDNIYYCKLLLKQGFYNYTYVTLNADDEIDNHNIEGSFYQTENQYYVLVYYRPIGSRYDQVIGIGSANSENLRN